MLLVFSYAIVFDSKVCSTSLDSRLPLWFNLFVAWISETFMNHNESHISGCQYGALKPGVRYTYDLCGKIQATNRLINEGSLLSNEVEQTLQLLETLKLIKKCQYMQILNCFESIREHGR